MSITNSLSLRSCALRRLSVVCRETPTYAGVLHVAEIKSTELA